MCTYIYSTCIYSLYENKLLVITWVFSLFRPDDTSPSLCCCSCISLFPPIPTRKTLDIIKRDTENKTIQFCSTVMCSSCLYPSRKAEGRKQRKEQLK